MIDIIIKRPGADNIVAGKYYVTRLIKLSQKRESLESIPVFAQNMAVRVLAELGDVRRFSNLNKISVFIGIDRERYQSGEMNSKFKHY